MKIIPHVKMRGIHVRKVTCWDFSSGPIEKLCFGSSNVLEVQYLRSPHIFLGRIFDIPKLALQLLQ